MSGLGSFSTSYFSKPSETLDPTLFDNRRIRPWVRQGILQILNEFYSHEYRHHELWSHPWLAGSGVSYQWEASRQPADLDCLIGIDYIQFRKANPEYAGLTDKEVSVMFNELFHSALHPKTADWHGYELTFYVNPGATDIRSINPYAAYDLKYDEWTVVPDANIVPPSVPEWDVVADADANKAKQIHTRFTQAVQDIQLSHGDALRRNAEVRMNAAKQQADALFEEIHGNRKLAFSMYGEGYSDFNNYRWQASKRSGAHHLLKAVRDYNKPEMAMPSAETLLIRAATYRAKM